MDIKFDSNAAQRHPWAVASRRTMRQMVDDGRLKMTAVALHFNVSTSTVSRWLSLDPSAVMWPGLDQWIELCLLVHEWTGSLDHMAMFAAMFEARFEHVGPMDNRGPIGELLPLMIRKMGALGCEFMQGEWSPELDKEVQTFDTMWRGFMDRATAVRLRRVS